jgi:hypothetical protein
MHHLREIDARTDPLFHDLHLRATMAENVKVKLAPQAGFCIKSSCLEDGVYNVPSSEEGPASTIPAPKGTPARAAPLYISLNAQTPPGRDQDIRQHML